MAVLVGREAPDFTTAAVLGSGDIVDTFNFKEATKGRNALIFFYPLDCLISKIIKFLPISLYL